MESIFLVTAIVGFVQLVKAVKAQDWESVSIILGSALIGGLTGAFGIDGLTISLGIQAGLSASGVYRISQVVSGK